MIHIAILALNRAVPASVADPRDVFQMANEFLKQSGRPAIFQVRLAGLSGEVILQDGLFSIHPDVMIADIHHTDLVIVPSMTGDIFTATHVNMGYIDWINAQYKKGAEIASLSVGAFLLAFSGLLKGRQSTTHWMYANEFRAHYPDTRVVDDKMITDQKGLYSSGGSYWNLLLYLVEKYTDRELAIRVSKYFVVDLDRDNQSPFAVFSGSKDHEDLLIKSTQTYIEQNYDKKLTVDRLAEMFCTSRRTFERRFKQATANTIIEYIQKVKIEVAKKQLETGRKTIGEIMYEVGYTDTKAFREVFRKITGISPAAYRDKYNKDAAAR